MPVSIEEVSADLVPEAGERPAPAASAAREDNPAQELRRQRDVIERMEARLLRIHAD